MIRESVARSVEKKGWESIQTPGIIVERGSMGSKLPQNMQSSADNGCPESTCTRSVEWIEEFFMKTLGEDCNADGSSHRANESIHGNGPQGKNQPFLSINTQQYGRERHRHSTHGADFDG
jgi:hypothetical protein